MIKWLTAAFFVALVSTSALADTITMKNGDLYRAEVLKEDFGNYVQILLKDGSEKRLPWTDIQSIERGAGPTSSTASSTIAEPAFERPAANAPGTADQYPTEMLNDRVPYRFELDLAAFSYDSTWQQVSLQTTGSSSSSSLNASNHYFRTAPMEFNFAAYLDRWHAYFTLLNSAVNPNDVSDGTFANFAFAYGVARTFDVGFFFNFNYSSTSANNVSASLSDTGSSYGLGPFVRLAEPITDRSALEVSLGAGLAFQSLNIGTTAASLNGSDTAFISYVKVGTSVSLCKYVSYVAWVDAWFDIGTLSGQEIASGSTSAGTLQDNVYRVRVVPLALRLKF